MITTPAKPTTRPMPRSSLMRSLSEMRANSTAKNGAVLRSTEAIAGPAYCVPRPKPASDRVVEPAPTTSANSQIVRERGNLPPRIGIRASRRTVAMPARRNVMMPAGA